MIAVFSAECKDGQSLFAKFDGGLDFALWTELVSGVRSIKISNMFKHGQTVDSQ